MKKMVFIIATVVFFANFSAKSQSKPPKTIPDQYIVVLKEAAAKPVIKQQKKNADRDQKFRDNNPARESNLKKLNELKKKKNIREENVKHNYADAIVGFTAKLSKTELESLKSDPDVAGVYPDYEVAYLLPPIKTSEVPLEPGDCFLQTVGGAGDGSHNGKWIWILDTGVELDHPDLKVNKAKAVSYINGENANDINGHGTHVAGIAAAKNDGRGMTGVSAGAPVVPVKIADVYGRFTNSALLAGLNYVSQFDVLGDVINLSLGAYPYSNCPETDPIIAAIMNLANEGTFVSIAAGNESGYASFSFPACAEGSRVITVAAINCNSSCTGYSNFGPGVDYLAVGTNVYSCYKNKSYATLSGTSMAAPVVTGILHLRGQPVAGPSILCKEWTKPIAQR